MKWFDLKDMLITFSVGIIALILTNCASTTFSSPTQCEQLQAKIEYINQYSEEYTVEEKVAIYELGRKGLAVCTTVSPIPDSSRGYKLKLILDEIDKYIK